MMNSLVIFVRFLLSHKWKILLTLVLVLTFLVLLFPLGDLNDVLSSQVSKMTSGKVYLQVEDIKLNPIGASLSLEKLYLETPQINSIASDEVLVRPSLAALLSQKPAGSIQAKGFLKGELEIQLTPIKTEGSGAEKSKIDFSASNINLKEMREALNLNLPIKGQLSLNSQAIADLSFSEQPEMDLNLSIAKFELSSAQLPLQDFGSIALPEIKLSKIELKGRLSGGKFLIENGKIGSNKDDLYGDIKGDLALSFQNISGQISPVIGAYNISLDLKTSTAFKEKAKLLLSFLDGYKSEHAGGTSYKFQIQASGMGMPPQINKLQ